MTSKFPPALILVAFTAAVFTSALLLFAVQPMFTRMVLPNLGGSPSVWSVAMVFFQSMLLAGYAYAHYLMKAKRSAVVVAVHIVLIIAAGLTLPLSIARGLGRAAGAMDRALARRPVCGFDRAAVLRARRPTIRCCRPGSCAPAIRTARIPISSTPPRTSAAFSRCCPIRSCSSRCCRCAPRPSCGPPAIGCCSRSSGRARSCCVRSPDAEGQVERAEAAPAPSWRAIGRWMFLAAVPSGLLVAVTAHISTDVAAAPLLWVVPLSLYLLTWVLVFQRRPLIPHPGCCFCSRSPSSAWSRC